MGTSVLTVDNNVLMGGIMEVQVFWSDVTCHALSMLLKIMNPASLHSYYKLRMDAWCWLLCTYMPTDYGTRECVEEYLDICTKITVLYNDSDGSGSF